MKSIIVALDSFKGSISSKMAAEAAERGINTILPNCMVRKVVIADGGEGSIDAICANESGTTMQRISIEVMDALMRPIISSYIINSDGVAFIEMASVAGLPMLKPEERNPTLTTTYGIGQMILDAIRRGCNNINLAIGGSSTNDAAIGIAAALGVKFLDKKGAELSPIGKNLIEIASIDTTNRIKELDSVKIKVACDVTSPMYGVEGAAYVYAPQKGATPEMVSELDDGLRNFSRVALLCCGTDISNIAGAGAAGGVGGGMMAMLGAKLVRGIDMILDIVDFNQLLANASLVITGEGRIDMQSFNGKVINGIGSRAKCANVPVIAIAGAVAPEVASVDINSYGIRLVEAIQPANTPLEIAMDSANTTTNITETVKRVIAEYHKHPLN